LNRLYQNRLIEPKNGPNKLKRAQISTDFWKKAQKFTNFEKKAQIFTNFGKRAQLFLENFFLEWLKEHF
jgi:hypothetical protein